MVIGMTDYRIRRLVRSALHKMLNKRLTIMKNSEDGLVGVDEALYTMDVAVVFNRALNCQSDLILNDEELTMFMVALEAYESHLINQDDAPLSSKTNELHLINEFHVAVNKGMRTGASHM